MLTCLYHCSPCGRHFHSLEAFDLHHERDEADWPICMDPVDLEDRDGEPRLAVLGIGECRVRGPIKRDVTIWTDARRVGMAASHFDSPETA